MRGLLGNGWMARGYKTFYLSPGRMVRIAKLARSPREMFNLVTAGASFFHQLIMSQ
jgi:hypothetical protein